MATTTEDQNEQSSQEPAAPILTLREAAAYLRVSEEEVLTAVQQQRLPGRQIGDQWRFLRSALDDWLRAPPMQQEILTQVSGAWKDDPYFDDMLEQIYLRREQEVAEEREP